MKSLGTLIVVLVLSLLLIGLIACEQAEQDTKKAKETIGSVTGGTDKSEDEAKSEDAESVEDEKKGQIEL